MTALVSLLDQQFASAAELSAAVRSAVGKSLRRPAGLTQLALVGALACVPPERRGLPTALFWQTTSGPRTETERLLDEMRTTAEPMPYDFLATQPAIAAATLQPWLPGLVAATHWPLPDTESAAWGPQLALALDGLAAGRFAQVLCAHLDTWEETARGRWLLLANEADAPLARLSASRGCSTTALADTPDLLRHLDEFLGSSDPGPMHVRMPAGYRLRVEFARPETP